MKVVTIIGARPQFVKAAAVSREISRHPELREVIVHTGQHFDANMSDVFFSEMRIPTPDYHLDVHSMGHGAMTGRMLEKIEALLLEEKPDYTLVYGDTNSTLAGALAAAKLHIPVVHVEAGLRSFNMRMPEEMNRILTDRISSILCCPTDHAVANLKREGFGAAGPLVAKTGDVMQDAALYYGTFSAERSRCLAELGLEEKPFVLRTVHRAENTDDPQRLRAIVEALNEVAAEIPVLLPLHPRTRKILEGAGLPLAVRTIDPVGYFDMIELLKRTRLVMTDSGGLQKEAYFFRKPCVTLRDETEWVELIHTGCNRLAGADKEKILACFKEAMEQAPSFASDLYGGGKASERIVELMLQGQ